MRRDVQDIFRLTPHEKQVMMFSATLSKEIRPVCKKFMQDVINPCPPSYFCLLVLLLFIIPCYDALCHVRLKSTFPKFVLSSHTDLSKPLIKHTMQYHLLH